MFDDFEKLMDTAVTFFNLPPLGRTTQDERLAVHRAAVNSLGGILIMLMSILERKGFNGIAIARLLILYLHHHINEHGTPQDRLDLPPAPPDVTIN